MSHRGVFVAFDLKTPGICAGKRGKPLRPKKGWGGFSLSLGGELNL